jgi:hypothetical protein
MQDITQRPAYLDGFEAGGFADTIGFARPPRIVTNDGFRVVSEDGIDVLPRSIDLKVIFLWENDTRLYYPKGEYDPTNPTPPDCFSDNRVTPSAAAIHPQSELCASCPHSVWDQPTPRGNLVPACDSRYKVACLVAGAGGKVFLLSVAPASRKPYELYRKYLKQHNAYASAVVTKLTYADKQLGFQFDSWVDEKIKTFIEKVTATNEPAEIVGSNDKPRQQALPAPEQRRELTPAAAAAPAATSFAPGPVIEDRPTRPATVVDPPAQRRTRGRPPKDEAPQAAQFGQAPAAPAARPTAQLNPASQGNGQNAVNPNVQGFGMEAPQAPNADIQKRLDEAFGPR